MQMLPPATLYFTALSRRFCRDDRNESAIRANRKRRRDFRFDGKTVWLSQRARVIQHAVKQFAQIEVRSLQFQSSGVRARQKQKIFRHRSQVMSLMQQRIGTRLLFRRCFGIGQDFLNPGAQYRDRRFQLM